MKSIAGFKTPHLLIILSLLVISPLRSVAQKHDGAYFFDALKQSMIDVLDDNQALINANADGSQKSPKLLSDAFYRSAYRTFKTIVGSRFSPKSLKGEVDPEQISHVLAALLQSGRTEIAKLQATINEESDGTVKPKKFIPAVFGRLTAEKFKEKTGVAMKQTTLGKNGYKARNQYNVPDSWENMALEKVAATDWPLNKGFGESVDGQYRYIKPIYIKQACLSCHGDPVGGPAPYDQVKEGYQVGEVRGGISLKIDLAGLIK